MVSDRNPRVLVALHDRMALRWRSQVFVRVLGCTEEFVDAQSTRLQHLQQLSDALHHIIVEAGIREVLGTVQTWERKKEARRGQRHMKVRERCEK
jgi:hypothetical protein